LLRNWRNRSEGAECRVGAAPDVAPAPLSARDPTSEIARLRRENDRLWMEGDISA
jgi:hypothetical protein